MHACGHDGHTAMLLAAARHLAEQGAFDGTLHLIFQPAEEGGGGALRMMEDGLFERFPCDAVFAMHNMPGIEQGRLVLARRRGDGLVGLRDHHAHRHRRPRRDAAPRGRPDRGRGQHRHGAADHRLAQHRSAAGGRDHRRCAACRQGQQRHPGLGDAGAQRACAGSRGARHLERRIKALVAAQAESFGVQAHIDWKPGYAVLVNTPAETAFAREVATELVGAEQVTLQGPPLTGSEDFAFMLERVPGSYLLIGNGIGERPWRRRLHGAQPRLRLQRRQRRHRQRLLGAAGPTLPGC